MRLLSVCFACGSFLPLKHGLCSFCISCVIRPSFQNIPFPHFSLVRWKNQKHAWMSTWARQLKGNQSRAWSLLAQQTAEAMIQHRILQKIPSGATLVVVDPSSKPDHSYWYAHHLARLLHAEHLAFSFVKNSEQELKNLGGQERLLCLNHYRLQKTDLIKYHLNQPHVFWLFIDDIMTTGATAKSVFQLLNHPQSFLALSWMSRDKGLSTISI